MNSCPIFNYPPVAVMFMVTAPIRGRARMSFFLSLHLRFVGGWGMLTFMGLAHLRDATLLHVLFKLYNYVMLRYCTLSSSYTTT